MAKAQALSSTGGPASGRVEAVLGRSCGVCGEKFWPWKYTWRLKGQWQVGRDKYARYQYTHQGPHPHSWTEEERKRDPGVDGGI